MTKFGIGLIMLMILCIAYAKWSEKVKIDECKTELKRAKLYLDQKSKTAHIFWCEFDINRARYHLLYRRQYSNNVLSPITVLDDQHACEMVSVTGHHDGEQVNVAYGASRKTMHSHCSKENTEGCLDVYALDSNDGGFTFSKPAVVMRRDLNDVWNRKYPKITANPISGRQWIFYVLANVENTNFGIGFITRSDGSINYSAEKVIISQKDLIIEASVAQSIYKGTSYLHLLYTGEVKGSLRLLRSSSSNNGASWSHPLAFNDGFAGRFYSHLKMKPDYMILPWLKSTSSPAKLLITSDNMGHWSEKSISSKIGIPEVEMCFKNKNDGMVFSMLNADLGHNTFEGQFGTMKVSGNTWTRGDNPFGSMNMAYDPNVGCYIENGQYIVKAVGIENSHPIQKNLYLTKNTIN